MKKMISIDAKSAINFAKQQHDLANADKLYSKAREIHKHFILQLNTGRAPNFKVLNTLSQEIIDSVFNNADALACLVMLKETNQYLVEHALNCSILLSVFAKYKGLSQAEIEDLSMAGLIMDSGMALLPPELSDDANTLNDADRILLETHINIAYELAERYDDLPPIILDVIANHHERIDGTGYPKHKTKDDISLYSQMAAIVDCYDTMLTKGVLRTSASSQKVLEIMLNDSGLDKLLINEFTSAIGLFPVGSLVHLQSGKLAIVVQRNKLTPLKPVVICFYSVKRKHHTEIKRVDLKQAQTDKIIGSVTPEEFDLNLPHFFRSALLP